MGLFHFTSSQGRNLSKEISYVQLKMPEFQALSLKALGFPQVRCEPSYVLCLCFLTIIMMKLFPEIGFLSHRKPHSFSYRMGRGTHLMNGSGACSLKELTFKYFCTDYLPLGVMTADIKFLLILSLPSELFHSSIDILRFPNCTQLSSPRINTGLKEVPLRRKHKTLNSQQCTSNPNKNGLGILCSWHRLPRLSSTVER